MHILHLEYIDIFKFIVGVNQIWTNSRGEGQGWSYLTKHWKGVGHLDFAEVKPKLFQPPPVMIV